MIEAPFSGQPATTSDDLRALLFEAVRELLFNVVKHAGIKEAAVRARMGRGFDHGRR